MEEQLKNFIRFRERTCLRRTPSFPFLVLAYVCLDGRRANLCDASTIEKTIEAGFTDESESR